MAESSGNSDIQRRDFMKLAAGAALAASSGASAAAAESELAMLTITEASKKIHSRQITCTQLTEACIERSKVYNPKVNAYITLMHEEALAQAKQLDAEAAAGTFRGPLHGILSR